MRTLTLGLVALAACGGSSFGGPDARPDGGFSADAGPSCRLSIMLTPSSPVAPVMIRAQATITGAVGFPVISWQVTGPPNGATIPISSNGDLETTFTAGVAGPYDVTLSVSAGNFCAATTTHVNVAAPNANTAMVRLRLTPPAGASMPPQADQTVLVVGGGDSALPASLVLSPGSSLSGRLSGPGGPLAAYLRLDADRPAIAELFADANGAYSGFLTMRSYNVLAVPLTPDVAPKVFAATFNQLASGLTLDAGDAVSGVVLDAGGLGLTGTLVAIAAGTLPASLTETGSDGTFAAHVRAASGPLSLTVLPASGALHLEIGAAAGVNVTAGSSITATLPDVPTATFIPLAVRSNGAALPGAIVTFVDAGGLPGGSVAVDGTSHPATAAVRASYVADASGALPSITLPTGTYHVVVDPGATPGQTLGRFDVDLAAPPATLAAAAPVATQVIVRNGTLPVASAQVFAIAAGAEGVGAGVTVAAVTDASGTATLGLAPGCSYGLLVEPGPAQPIALGRGTTIGGAGPTTVTLALAIKVTGRVVSPVGPGQRGVRVEVFCGDCTGPDADMPLDAAVTDGDGGFTLRVPDPGVGK